MKNLYVLLGLLAVPLATAAACAQSIKDIDGRLVTGVTAAVPGQTLSIGARTCTITFKGGDVKTDGCDFSLPLRSPKISPVSTDQVKMEFDQTVNWTATTNSIVTGGGNSR